MVELKANPASDLSEAVDIGAACLTALEPDHITSIAPYDGAGKSLSDALKSAHGMPMPAIGRMNGRKALRCMWTGRGQYFLIGNVAADPGLGKFAALSDQSSAWAGFRIAGEDAENVMARLTPLDLRPGVFKRGHVARSEFSHMMAIIARSGIAQIDVYVMRSFAKTARHHLNDAMRSVAARAKTVARQ